MTNKYELLRWLDDPDLQEKIRQIVAEPKKFSEPEKIPMSEKISSPKPDESLSKLETENRRLKEKLQALEFEKNSVQRQLDTLRGENYQLQNSLAKTQQRVKELEQQIQTAQYRNSRLESSLSQSEQSARSLQDKLKEWQSTFNREQQRAKNLQRDLDDANQKISELEAQLQQRNQKISELEAQLQQRFARGWELFQKYQRVGSHARQLLQGVFPRDDFMSFICGGAQVNSLETLWDVLRECVMNNRPQDAETLSEVFEYCLELVNATKAQAGYSILPVKPGDRFDSDLHSEGPNSRAQGKISNVYLPGYHNDYNGRVIRKSIVQVS